MSKIKVVENSDMNKFENEVNELLKDGYSITSTSCGCNVYHAILITCK